MARESLPLHVAVIPDGNRRWARRNNVDYSIAYRRGYENARRIMTLAYDMGTMAFSLFALSRDNCIKRDKELHVIYPLLAEAFYTLVDEYRRMSYDTRLLVLGDLKLLPRSLVSAINYARAEMNSGSRVLAIALCYSGSWEVDYYVRRGLMPESLKLPQVDLLIRTGGFHRVSTFIPLRLEYAEFYFTDVLWPDFDEREYMRALDWFSSQERRFGA